MISDQEIRSFFLSTQSFLSPNILDKAKYQHHIFRGVDGPVGCEKWMAIFTSEKIIPEYCFSCFKVSVEVPTVVDLLKLLLVLDRIQLPNDNLRKAMVELRENIPKPYKGYVYCSERQEAIELKSVVRRSVAEGISKQIPVTIKRGCSEYPIIYPEYGKVGGGEGDSQLMKYKEAWRSLEEVAARNYDEEHQIKQRPKLPPGFDINAAITMRFWLNYSLSIGDISLDKLLKSV